METTTTTIYVVTAGEYSDYGICAMFSRREDAERYIELHGGKCRSDVNRYADYSIEEYGLDEHRGAEWVSVYSTEISMGTGDIRRRDESQVLSTDLFARKSRVDVFDHSSDCRYHTARAYSGVSQDHADKLAVEARQKYLREKGTEYAEACTKRTQMFKEAAAHPVHQDPYFWTRGS